MFSASRYILIFLCGFQLAAQTPDTIAGGGIKLYDFYAGFGQVSLRPWLTTPGKFSGIMPSSPFMAGDLASIDQATLTAGPELRTAKGFFVPDPRFTALYLQAGATFKLRDNEYRDLDGPWVKAGLNYFGSTMVFSGGVFRSTVKSDSVEQAAGFSVQRDSMRIRSLEYTFRHESVNAEATFFYQVNARGIISVFGGAGVMAGVNFSSRAKIVYTDLIYTADSIHFAGGNRAGYGFNTVSTRENDTRHVRAGFGAGVFLDIGINLRLGQYISPFRNLYLFGEFRPLLKVDYIRGFGSHTTLMNIVNLGLRYQFSQPGDD